MIMKNFFFFIKGKLHVIFIVLIFFVLLFLTFSNYGIFKRITLEKNKKELIRLILKEKKIQDSLKQKINDFTYDTTEIERVAREKYGMLKPSEKVYFIKEKSKK